MKSENNISKSVISRLPRYYRLLGLLLDRGIERISSRELSKETGLTASQIRQDFNCFGGFGQQGYGYNVKQLRDSIGHIIGIDKKYKIILVGAGNLGRAIAQHLDFTKKGFDLVGIFDSDLRLTGLDINNLAVRSFDDIDEFCKQFKPTAAILCIPEKAGKEVTQKLFDCGISGFWNFSHYNISEDFPNAVVENVHLNDSLMKLCYNLTNTEEQREKNT
ncbi:MAG: redox-sensing transcriptional repressor Rex [Clostridiales bacterium]|nr:redox-sensing transcriptional repressor Rex [Clostridiales bacterium]MCD7827574.1 redox-sensing transcriptional repressor Rex [Clostridiales bacterium]